MCRFLPLPLVGRGGAEGAGVGSREKRTMPHTAITRRTRVNAQRMRRAPTDAERRMWQLLRTLKPLGMHFRRQAPIGNYVADFAWYEGKLIIAGSRQRAVEESNQHRVERPSGEFSRVVALPHEIDLDSIDAAFELGVLHVTLPKIAKQQPKKIQIRTSDK